MDATELYHLYIDFLKYSLSSEESVPCNINDIPWDDLYRFSIKQSIAGIIFQGIEKLSRTPYRLDKKKMFKWYYYIKKIEKENEQANIDNAKISFYLYKKAGIRSCTLKGQANALMYPNPLWRTSGDIDLWTDKDTIDIIRYVKSVVPEAGIEYHHIEFPVAPTHAEIHFVPSFMGNLFYEWRLRKYFKRHKEEQFKNIAALPNSAGEIYTLDRQFDLIFQMTHIMHHFFFEGIGLRQFIDYYYLLKTGFSDAEKEETIKTLKWLNMYKFSCGVMWVLENVLGLNQEYLITPTNEKIGKMMLNEIIQAGNLGQFDERYTFEGKSRMQQFLLETYRNLHFAIEFPSETIFGRPISRFWHYFYKMYLNRKAIGASAV